LLIINFSLYTQKTDIIRLNQAFLTA
jgi:hypothetical protein